MHQPVFPPKEILDQQPVQKIPPQKGRQGLEDANFAYLIRQWRNADQQTPQVTSCPITSQP